MAQRREKNFSWDDALFTNEKKSSVLVDLGNAFEEPFILYFLCVLYKDCAIMPTDVQ